VAQNLTNQLTSQPRGWVFNVSSPYNDSSRISSALNFKKKGQNYKEPVDREESRPLSDKLVTHRRLLFNFD